MDVTFHEDVPQYSLQSREAHGIGSKSGFRIRWVANKVLEFGPQFGHVGLS